MQWLRRWYGLLKFLSWFPNPLQYRFCGYVAEQGRMLLGMIQVSPFNRTRSTWRIDRVMLEQGTDKQGIGSQLLRHCFESILEARTWLLEVNVNDKDALALYRQNGFQRLAEMTYWEIEAELLAELAQGEPDLPNLLPVSNADAQLLYQLDTASMPPLVRQVFDRNTRDFKTSLFGVLTDAVKQWVTKTEIVSGYVFEPQRKAAIGHFQVQLDRKGEVPHVATLTVHPAYTWLYPELLSQLARIAQDFPQQGLQLASSDYQPEREEYLERIGAKRIEHTLIMSRSVWHKLRESKFVSLEGIQWTDMLQGLQPARKPVPGGMSWLQPGKSPSDRPLPAKSEPLNFSGKNTSMEASSQPESADAQQEK
jgi:GNAT superfamily N-acetyltransferase